MSTLEMFIEEGKKEAVEKTKIEDIQRMHKNGFTIEQIMIALDVDEKFIEEAIKKMK